MHSGGIEMFYQTAEHFYVEVLQIYGANVVNFKMALSGWRWFILGCYLAQEDASPIEEFVMAISQWPWGAALLVVGDFNTNLALLEGWERDEEIAVDMEESGLEDMSGHFLP